MLLPIGETLRPTAGGIGSRIRAAGRRFLGINSNAQDSLADVAAFARLHCLPFPVLKDPDHTVADALGAMRTPEVFVLDGEVPYQ
jgi:peroxiredoxin